MSSPQRKRPPCRAGLSTALFAGALVAVASGTALPAAAQDLLAHRAVYELSLVRTDRDANVSDASGLFVFQVKGSACAGWTVVSDIALTIEDREGNAVRTTTQYRAFEDAAGDVFTFQTATSHGGGDEVLVTGAAERQQDGSVQVRRFGDEESRTQAPAGTLFPNQLTLAMLDAARAGEPFLFLTVFDGSHDAGLPQPASAFIGRPVAPSVVATIDANRSAIRDRLDEEGDTWIDFPTPARAWPVRLSYFDPQKPDSPPDLQVSYTLDTNGVSDDLVLDYGVFALRGVLSDFTAFRPSPCGG